MSTSLSPVTFHGDTIFCTTYQNQPYTAMKPIIENMGLDWGSQFRKLSGCKERWGVVIMTIPSASGDQQTLCMPVRKLPAFLNTINPKKVRPELRERIELYQNESDDVLWEYWTNQQNLRSMPFRPLSTVESRRKLNSLVREWAALSGQSFPDCWAEVHVAFDVEAIASLPAAKVKEAEAWVTARIREHTKPALPDFKHELADYGSINIWDELKQAERILKKCSGFIALACNSGCSMYMTPEKHLFHRILTQSADHAAASVMMAMQAVSTCLSIKGKVDFFKI